LLQKAASQVAAQPTRFDQRDARARIDDRRRTDVQRQRRGGENDGARLLDELHARHGAALPAALHHPQARDQRDAGQPGRGYCRRGKNEIRWRYAKPGLKTRFRFTRSSINTPKRNRCCRAPCSASTRTSGTFRWRPKATECSAVPLCISPGATWPRCDRSPSTRTRDAAGWGARWSRPTSPRRASTAWCRYTRSPMSSISSPSSDSAWSLTKRCRARPGWIASIATNLIAATKWRWFSI